MENVLNVPSLITSQFVHVHIHSTDIQFIEITSHAS